MGGLFSKPSVPSMPKSRPISPPPDVITGGEEWRRMKGRKGRLETIVTGELEPITTKKTLLG